MHDNYQLLVHRPFAVDRQLLLADPIGDLRWAYDLQTGILSFGDRFAWKAEVLGTESTCAILPLRPESFRCPYLLKWSDDACE